MDLKAKMWHKSKFYVIGLYEELVEDIYPSHFTPIIAEKKDGLFRRWSYSIKFPYQIELSSPVGSFKKNHEDLFPVKTLHYITPIELTSKTQVIAISHQIILISDNKTNLVFKIMGSALMRKPDIRYLYRTVKTIRNVIE